MQHPTNTTQNQDVWAIIPARYGSTRFPGKPLALVAGEPMITHVYRRCMETVGIKHTWVATDDQRIVDAVEACGGSAILTGEHESGTDRIAAALPALEAQHPAPGWVLNVQGDEPLISPKDLDRLITGMQAIPDALMGTLVYPLRSESELLDANIVKAVLNAQQQALYFSRSPIPHPRGKGALGWRHMGIYLMRRHFVECFHQLPATPLSTREQLEQLRAMEHGVPIYCFQAEHMGVGVDAPTDLAEVERLLVEMSS